MARSHSGRIESHPVVPDLQADTTVIAVKTKVNDGACAWVAILFNASCAIR